MDDSEALHSESSVPTAPEDQPDICAKEIRPEEGYISKMDGVLQQDLEVRFPKNRIHEADITEITENPIESRHKIDLQEVKGTGSEQCPHAAESEEAKQLCLNDVPRSE